MTGDLERAGGISRDSPSVSAAAAAANLKHLYLRKHHNLTQARTAFAATQALAHDNNMQAAQRTALRSARRLRPQVTQKQPRRFETQGAEPSSFKAEGGHANYPKNESFGSAFYLTLAAIPLSLALYNFTRQGTSEQPWATRYIIETYNGYAEKWARRNDIHTQMIEQAASDKLLFINEASHGPRLVDLRFPEQFNIGSPYNVPAGQGSANLDHVIAKFERESYADNERKLQQLRDNKVPSEQPMPETLAKVSGAASPPGA
ncbi:hypothetical protein LTR91_004218 [Friedmanniomyces endolithicus]|uniref:NADH-ubiquinone oxidoreductase 17.8 kDa subunit, mitochondrial n=1 Tax=Friedmanniomyces endolithicus TaxID=329885 RepID=A0AAN6KWT3_9PEZI|nr:hypothetical protein LTR57_005325 [Friedmanniomyces endolithicus]KAK1004723.1 hypothetical protein LTR91_004218 [Friedmanniomyces endolithicus]KAK1045880.1 hypothetical protein LTS16_006306 [Friedmanniomyces endolithicus]